jgi:hypothetical protein
MWLAPLFNHGPRWLKAERKAGYPFPRGLASDVNVAVVGMPAECMAPVFQFPIQSRQQDVRQRRTQRPALRLRYVHPAHRRRDVFPCQQFGLDRRPVQLRVAFEFSDANSIDSGGAFVLDHSLIRALQVPVRQASALPSASSRFAVARNTLAVRLSLPLAGQEEDFHLQVSAPCRAHKKKAPRFAGPFPAVWATTATCRTDP